ncbi:tRNA (adenine(58)-N(1))-methyltransferase catalytic subunit TRMT61A [Malaya genurostris]|uniref:tRNA (adenine(58)-N(1))-methyltransferase catalytic subunit TRMT61A n=1 Tax=Malaya genurostris TaxID=325434 RepID=UPI0026F3E40A|nr:tRNA (adenine(58)-N(1))-methyltransferase catalytic subunit TRMT61A [Malaya genurostris]
MSFAQPKTIIDEGDTVILYLTITNVYAIEAIPQIKNKKGEMVENVFQTNFGALKVKDIIGVQYGSKVELSKGWAHVLQPNPELWTQTLPHRTQILYTPDISMILHQLEIKPGSIVIESGTGSGSLSHYFLRAIRPHGYLYTFDFHEERAQKAQDEFNAHGLGEYVKVTHRDVCENGFGDELNGTADAVFLDLPAPQLAIPHALKALKNQGGRICSFSPCIEQSSRVCEALEQNGFVDIVNIEILQVEDIVKTKNIPVMDLEFVKHKKTAFDKDTKTPKDTKKYITSSAPNTTTGHTGYLTVAEFPPLFAR